MYFNVGLNIAFLFGAPCQEQCYELEEQNVNTELKHILHQAGALHSINTHFISPGPAHLISLLFLVGCRTPGEGYNCISVLDLVKMGRQRDGRQIAAAIIKQTSVSQNMTNITFIPVIPLSYQYHRREDYEAFIVYVT